MVASFVGLAAATVAAPPVLPPDGGAFETRITRTYPAHYLVALPEGYADQPRKRWPLLIFLHGSGERGTDLELLRVHGPFREIAQGRRYPFIVAAPQCPPEVWWDVEVLTKWLDHIERKYRVDRARIVLSGISMGGYGTWAWAAAQPNRFAGILPVCGGGDPKTAPAIRDVPAWVVHGDEDRAVPVEQSREMVAALRAAGARVRYDEIPGGGHDVWTDLFARDDLYAWIAARRRP